jgi:hypothetical protein
MCYFIVLGGFFCPVSDEEVDAREEGVAVDVAEAEDVQRRVALETS